jgi:hypothetical protein
MVKEKSSDIANMRSTIGMLVEVLDELAGEGPLVFQRKASETQVYTSSMQSPINFYNNGAMN